MTRHPRKRVPSRSLAVLAFSLGSAILLAGCTATPSPSAEPTELVQSESPAPTGTVPPTDQAPVLMADGSAEDNLPLFSEIVASVWAGADNQFGRAYIDALVAAGFDKASMQVTEDESTVGNRAESLQFSVQWGTDCLVGQVGPATGEPVSVVVPALAEGGCLIGSTRPIDW